MTDLWTKVNTNPDFFPTAEQELLLHAALDRGTSAVGAWKTWRSRVDVDRLDVGSHRLLPLLYRNMSAHGVQDPLLPRIKGVHRRTWYENQLLFNSLAGLLQLFRLADIKTMVLKGAAIALAHYRDIGARPMDDFDILVPFREASRAMDLIHSLGWKSKNTLPDKGILMATTHSWDFVNESGLVFDFHWHVSFENLEENADDDFWRAAVPLEVNRELTVTLCSADQLLHVCAHGALWNPIPPIRWVADAMVILNSSQGQIDWDRYLNQARRCRLTLHARDTLMYLRERFGAPVPEGLLEDLKRSRTSFIQRSIYRDNASSVQEKGLLIGLLLLFREHSKRERKAGWFRKVMHFPTFLQNRWGLVHAWQMPGYVASNSVRRIRRRFFL